MGSRTKNYRDMIVLISWEYENSDHPRLIALYKKWTRFINKIKKDLGEKRIENQNNPFFS